ncbi:hypothetical protein Mboo_1846 [Methanoregula boonei 6A8]|jgi:hypothetical protein|uniref:PsbP C-terminal domain-containing protein n=1 Tax=Methanoregula boonei (strain DSM 21154 / JCM 14090 / 6A8) TaxID=456442 RepID=A7I9F0_METB6|nr:hypothetical protein [Methanoregula boonei]ABS56361.1 hypothetical protein Mboo_1846 [Methanoregula boonei 6A8]
MNGNKARVTITVIGGILLGLLVISAGCSSTGGNAPTTAAITTPVTTLPPAATSASLVETTIIPVTTTPPPYQVYTDPTYPLTMDYPAGWVYNQPGNFTMEDYGKMTRNIANFYSPNATQVTYRTFSVDVDPSPGSDLEDYFNHATVALGKTYDPLTVTRHDAMYTVSGYRAYRLDFTKPDNTNEIVVFTITPDNVGYIFTYNAMEDADFQTLMHSVNITSVAAATTNM